MKGAFDERQRMQRSYATCCMVRMIRKLAMGALMVGLATAAFSAEKINVWVILTEPPVAAAPQGQLEKVTQQQDQVMARLKLLGATELAPLAVAIDSSKVPGIKRISGVRSVSEVQHIERDPIPGPPPVR